MKKNEEIEALRTVIYDLVNEAASVRDMLHPITNGMIERGKTFNVAKRGVLNPGLRKTKLSDAVVICNAAIVRINRATSEEKVGVNQFGHTPTNKENDFTRGFFCAVAALINKHDTVDTDANELFREGGDPAKADPQDIETFKKHGLMK